MRAQADDASRLIFRNMFIDKEDVRIAEIVLNYFTAVKNRWPEAWESTGTGQVLPRTNGFRGFMRFLRDAYLHYTTNEQVVTARQFQRLFDKVEIEDEEFNSDRFKPGTGGETAIYNLLCEGSGVA